MSERIVEILYFDGCPNVDETSARVQAAISAAGADGISVRSVHVTTVAAAEEVRFLGSPSVRVDGVDVDPSALTRTDYGLQCRLYSVGDHVDGAPPVDWICRALTGEAPPEVRGAALAPACCARKTS